MFSVHGVVENIAENAYNFNFIAWLDSVDIITKEDDFFISRDPAGGDS